MPRPLVFSRKTISSPRRKISTSLLFSRNAFGRRTACELPDLNTRATAIRSIPPQYILTCIYQIDGNCNRDLELAHVTPLRRNHGLLAREPLKVRQLDDVRLAGEHFFDQHAMDFGIHV